MARTKERKQEMQVCTRDYTLNMHKRLQGIAFKKRATRAVRTVARFAQAAMHTEVSFFCQIVALLISNFFSRVIGCESGHSTQQIPLVQRNQKRSKNGQSQNQQKEERGRGCQTAILQHLSTP